MIWYVVTREHFYTVAEYLAIYGYAFSTRPRIVFYDQLERARRLPSGTYIFSDIERLTSAAAERAAQVWSALSAAGDRVHLLNHPTRSMHRYELLRTLYADGVNAFNIYRFTDAPKPERFPVFVRREEHGGYVSKLLKTPDALAAETAALVHRGQSREDKLVIEFCDTADAQGIFRKYSAFVVGDCIIPAHLFFSQNWLANRFSANDYSPEMLAEERVYMEENPHAEALVARARRAGIDFGRIDYGIFGGSLQVWEINTNPQLPLPLRRHAVVPEQIPFLELSIKRLTAALVEIDIPARTTQISISSAKANLLLWGKRGLGMLPHRYQLPAKRMLWRWYHASIALRQRS